MPLRPADPDDAMGTLLPAADFATRDAQRPGTIVAVEEGAIVGFATTSRGRIGAEALESR